MSKKLDKTRWFNQKHKTNYWDIQRENVVNNVDRSSLRAPWQNGTFKNKHIEQHKNAEKPDVTDIQNKLLIVFWILFSFFF